MILGFCFLSGPFLKKHCKALRTETYRRYIHILLYYHIISCIAPSPSKGKLVPMRIIQLVHSSLLLVFGFSGVVSREVLYHILSHW